MIFTTSEAMRYRDFVVEMHSAEPGVYRVRVAASPFGESTEFPLHLALSPLEIDETLASVTYSSGNYLKRSNASGAYDPVVTLGQRLFQELLRESPIGRLFRQAQEAVQSRAEGLRLRIVSNDRAVMAIPWEFLFDATQSSFLALSLRTPVVRQAELATPLTLQPVDLPLRVWVVTAEVSDFGADKEIAILRELAASSGLLDLHVLEGATFAAFKSAVPSQRPHVLHFIATGAYGSGRGRWSKAKSTNSTGENQGLLFLGQADGRQDRLDSAEFVPATELAETLQGAADLRFVLLNACDTDLVAAELGRRIPAVLGVRSKVLNWTCEAMTQGLYEALLAGQPLEAAVTAGRQTIDRRYPGTREWGLPTFYLNAAHGILLGETTRAAASAAAPGTAESVVPPDQLASSPAGTGSADVREQRRLQSMLEIETRNRDHLRAQQQTLGEATPAFIQSQLVEAEQKVAELQAKLQSLAPNL